jgi:hypothetical protein
VQIKTGVWCFENPKDARRYMPGQDREFTPGPKRLNKKYGLGNKVRNVKLNPEETLT